MPLSSKGIACEAAIVVRKLAEKKNVNSCKNFCQKQTKFLDLKILEMFRNL